MICFVSFPYRFRPFWPLLILATIFNRVVDIRLQLLYVFFFFPPSSLRFSPVFRIHRPRSGISLPRSPPRHLSLYRRPSADDLEGPTMPGRVSSKIFAVFSRVGVTYNDGRPSFNIYFTFFLYTLFQIFSRGERHVSVNVTMTSGV